MTYDVAYFLSSESPRKDWELKYSLRSWEKFFPSLGRVWILGEHKPEWLNEESVSRIAVPDAYKRNKDANLITKLIRVSMEPELSERFISCSDDHFLLKPLAVETLRPYYTGDMARNKKDADWKKGKWHARLRRTKEQLEHRGFPVKDYGGHIPYMLEKSKVKTYLDFDYGHDIGYGVFTLYFNSVDTPDIAHIGTSRIRAGFFDVHTPSQVQNKMDKNQFMVFSEKGFNPAIQTYMEELLPEPSRYEL